MINYQNNIYQSELSIYDYIDPDNQQLFIPTDVLETILRDSLIGLSLTGLALRTRSKVVKRAICRALGYPIPNSFARTQPRFPGQNFDIYIQKRLNVQIWNEEIDSARRYVFLKVNDNDIVSAVRVICGDELVQYDRTGTLTQKYQATMKHYDCNICSDHDSITIQNWITHFGSPIIHASPTSLPCRQQLLGISEIYHRLLPIVGKTIDYIDAVQERNRSAELHAMICDHLGYSTFKDDGSYPDIKNQLLEIKLQTSQTIDLGLHSPQEGKKICTVDGTAFFSQDIRYAIFDGIVIGNKIHLKNLYLVTGEDFANYFPLFHGKEINTKIQLPLPKSFFD